MALSRVLSLCLHRSSGLARRQVHRELSCRSCASTSGTSDDEKHLKTYHVNATGVGGGTTATVRGHTIRTDLPRNMGGKDEHPQPVELMVSALIGCEQATAAFVARQMKPRLPLKGITFEYVAWRDERGATALPLDAPAPFPPRLLGVRGTATVHLAKGTESMKRIDELRRMTEARCPVANTLTAGGCQLDIRWRLAAE